jgi:hypothetical protein
VNCGAIRARASIPLAPASSRTTRATRPPRYARFSSARSTVADGPASDGRTPLDVALAAGAADAAALVKRHGGKGAAEL